MNTGYFRLYYSYCRIFPPLSQLLKQRCRNAMIKFIHSTRNSVHQWRLALPLDSILFQHPSLFLLGHNFSFGSQNMKQSFQNKNLITMHSGVQSTVFIHSLLHSRSLSRHATLLPVAWRDKERLRTWRPINYSIGFVVMTPTSLAPKQHFFCILSTQTGLVGVID